MTQSRCRVQIHEMTSKLANRFTSKLKFSKFLVRLGKSNKKPNDLNLIYILFCSKHQWVPQPSTSMDSSWNDQSCVKKSLENATNHLLKAKHMEKNHSVLQICALWQYLPDTFHFQLFKGAILVTQHVFMLSVVLAPSGQTTGKV